MRIGSILLILVAGVGIAAAESGLAAWLRYAPLGCSKFKQPWLPSIVVALNDSESSPVFTAGTELQQGILSIFNEQVAVTHNASGGDWTSSVVVGTAAAYTKATGKVITGLEPDGFWLSIGSNGVSIVGQNERGALYGAFEYLSMLAQGNFSTVSYVDNPKAPIRWVNQWDNLDGTIERGWGGLSVFWNGGFVMQNLTRAAMYGRLLASIRLNAVVINNVNADANILQPQNIAGISRIANAMRPYGVQVGLSLNFAAPQAIGNLSTFDPIDPAVIQFWNDETAKIYQVVPDMAGYLVKANSEGQPGPLTYNRTLADGANLFARAVQPYGGVVMFRAFVYDNTINESDWKADRANAAVDFFTGLDGKFDNNVVVQIKYGPIDFQIREPASPLFAYLRNTNTAIELQITQEYLGQQAHLVYLPPLWKTIFNWDMRVDDKPSEVQDIFTGQVFSRPLSGYAGVVNVGLNDTWLGSHMAQSNLYAFGRLAWDPRQDSFSVLRDWTRLTFGLNRRVIDTIRQISLQSWPAYENYTGNLGVQTLTDITGTHYPPKPQSQDGNGWGQWTRADHTTIGMDRTVSNGTGFAGQYPPELAAVFESRDTTPDDLMLWFHHVNYTYVLHSGETVIQHFYNAHYAGAETAQTFPVQWQAVKGLIDDERYEDVLFKLIYQAGHSIVWRDSINTFYNNLSGIPDELGRVNNHPWRVEAETMTLSGYKPTVPAVFECASNYLAIATTSSTEEGTATASLAFPDGTYDVAVAYYDLSGGQATWEAWINDRQLGSWKGDLEYRLTHSPSTVIDGGSEARITFKNIQVKTGDMLKIVGHPNGKELAPIDYVAFLPAGIVD